MKEVEEAGRPRDGMGEGGGASREAKGRQGQQMVQVEEAGRPRDGRGEGGGGASREAKGRQGGHMVQVDEAGRARDGRGERGGRRARAREGRQRVLTWETTMSALSHSACGAAPGVPAERSQPSRSAEVLLTRATTTSELYVQRIAV